MNCQKKVHDLELFLAPGKYFKQKSLDKLKPGNPLDKAPCSLRKLRLHLKKSCDQLKLI